MFLTAFALVKNYWKLGLYLIFAALIGYAVWSVYSTYHGLHTTISTLQVNLKDAETARDQYKNDFETAKQVAENNQQQLDKEKAENVRIAGISATLDKKLGDARKVTDSRIAKINSSTTADDGKIAKVLADTISSIQADRDQRK